MNRTAVSAQPEVGRLLPCNVTVEEDGDSVRVRFVDQEGMMSAGGLDGIKAIKDLGEDAKTRLARAAAALGRG